MTNDNGEDFLTKLGGAISERIPKPPASLGHCENCRVWGKEAASNVINTPMGAVRVADLIKAGTRYDPAVVQTVAHCRLFPKWEITDGKHWCWQFARRLDG